MKAVPFIREGDSLLLWSASSPGARVLPDVRNTIKLDAPNRSFRVYVSSATERNLMKIAIVLRSKESVYKGLARAGR